MSTQSWFQASAGFAIAHFFLRMTFAAMHHCVRVCGWSCYVHPHSFHNVEWLFWSTTYLHFMSPDSCTVAVISGCRILSIVTAFQMLTWVGYHFCMCVWVVSKRHHMPECVFFVGRSSSQCDGTFSSFNARSTLTGA